jgi:uncharacterized membrane protein
MLTVALLWRFAWSTCRFSRFQAALLAVLLATLSPMYVAYAQEVRSYAMITFLATASTFTLWRLLFPNPKQEPIKKQKTLLLLHILLTAACLYTH